MKLVSRAVGLLTAAVAGGCVGRVPDHAFDGLPVRYQIQLAAGLDPASIRLAFPDANLVEIDTAGELILHVGPRAAHHLRPSAYQDINGRRQNIDVRFTMDRDGDVRVAIGQHDSHQPVVIEPGVQ